MKTAKELYSDFVPGVDVFAPAYLETLSESAINLWKIGVKHGSVVFVPFNYGSTPEGWKKYSDGTGAWAGYWKSIRYLDKSYNWP